MKKETPVYTFGPSLEQEYNLHLAVVNAFDKYDGMADSGVRVPRVFDIIHADDEFWGQNTHKFPIEHQSPGTMMHMERILPLPKVARQALITHFYPSDNGSPSLSPEQLRRVLDHTPNKHCLARTYLGKDNGSFTTDSFSLRNFPLYLRPMQELGLDVMGLASAMGKAFAIMHWGAGVNGDDVEFVLGTSAMTREGSDALNFQRRAVGFHLLDFGQCDLVDLEHEDEDTVYQSFKGAMVTGDNQLFIPHYAKSPELFSAFKGGYMEAGQMILEERGMPMVDKFNVEDFMREYEEYAEDFL